MCFEINFQLAPFCVYLHVINPTVKIYSTDCSHNIVDENCSHDLWILVQHIRIYNNFIDSCNQEIQRCKCDKKVQGTY